MNLVWEHYPNGGSPLLLMLACADHAHDDGYHMRAGIPRLASKIRMSLRQTRRLVKKEEEDGWLVLVKQGHGRHNPNHYRINIEKLLEQPLAREPEDDESDDLNSDNLSPYPVDNLSTTEQENSDNLSPLQQEKGSPVSQKGVTHVTQTIINQSNSNSHEPSAVFVEQKNTMVNFSKQGAATVPQSSGEWARFFEVHDFEEKAARSPKAMIMYDRWVREGVTLGEVDQAIEGAKDYPHDIFTPTFYDKRVMETVSKRKGDPLPKYRKGVYPFPESNEDFEAFGRVVDMLPKPNELWPEYRSRLLKRWHQLKKQKEMGAA